MGVVSKVIYTGGINFRKLSVNIGQFGTPCSLFFIFGDKRSKVLVKNTGKNKLLERLASQTGSKDMAAALLNRRGQMSGNKLTPLGKKRQALGASGRAKDRAAKAQGGKPSDYIYNAKTNAAKKKK